MRRLLLLILIYVVVGRFCFELPNDSTLRMACPLLDTLRISDAAGNGVPVPVAYDTTRGDTLFFKITQPDFD